MIGDYQPREWSKLVYARREERCLRAQRFTMTTRKPSGRTDVMLTLCVAFSLWIVCPATGLAQPTDWTVLHSNPVALVADDWCPQHCEVGTTEKGYVVDIVSQALAVEGVPFTMRYVPWTRAMRMVERGEVDGLLTPTVPGFPQFRYHRQAVGYQQYCFYVDKATDWKYTGYADLRGKHIGMLADSGLGPLDAYLQANKGSITVHALTGTNNFATRLFKFLALKRADTVVLTSDVFDYSQAKGLLGNKYKYAGCLDREKMAVGLTNTDVTRSDLIGKALDSGIEKLRQSGKLASILAVYGMKDWDPPTNAKKGSVPPTTPP